MSPPILTEDVRRALTAGRLAHLTTVNPDGSPQASVIHITPANDVPLINGEATFAGWSGESTGTEDAANCSGWAQ